LFEIINNFRLYDRVCIVSALRSGLDPYWLIYTVLDKGVYKKVERRIAKQQWAVIFLTTKAKQIYSGMLTKKRLVVVLISTIMHQLELFYVHQGKCPPSTIMYLKKCTQEFVFIKING